jgi:hypothetical protein
MKDDEITEREITERLKSQKPVRLDPKNRKEIPASPGVYGGFYSHAKKMSSPAATPA